MLRLGSALGKRGLDQVRRLFWKRKSRTAYQEWLSRVCVITDSDREQIARRVAELSCKPLFYVVAPLLEIDEASLRKTIESVRKQLYPHWKLLLTAETGNARALRSLAQHARTDPRITVVPATADGHLPAAGGKLPAAAAEEFICTVHAGDELSEHCLYLYAEELNRFPAADLLYCDEDSVASDGGRYQPHFKSEWDPDLFLSLNFIARSGVFRRSSIDAMGGLRIGAAAREGHDLALRFTERIDERNIRHVPHILYHGRGPGDLSARIPAADREARDREAIQAHLDRTSTPGLVTDGRSRLHRVRYVLPDTPPLVSVIVPTRNQLSLLQQVSKGVLEKTLYPHLELIIVDNQSDSPETLQFLRDLSQDARVRVLRYDAPFNFSAINNFAVRHAGGDLVCFLNNDIEVISGDWMQEMASHALRPGVGAVGAKLLYPGTLAIQHAGIVLGLCGGVAAHPFRGAGHDENIDWGRPQATQRYSAVTAACLVIMKKRLEEAGGFDEELPVAYNDVDLCLRLTEKGYHSIYTPYAELVHHESATRGSDTTPEKLPRLLRDQAYMRKRWGTRLLNDPYYNANLTLDAENLGLAYPPRVELPWRSAGT